MGRDWYLSGLRQANPGRGTVRSPGKITVVELCTYYAEGAGPAARVAAPDGGARSCVALGVDDEKGS